MTTSAITPPAGGGVLVASPSSSFREQVLHSYQEHSWPVQEATGGADALSKLETGDWQLLFLDRCLPDLDAEELVEIIKRRFPGIEVVVLDSDGGQVLPVCGGANGAARWRSAHHQVSAPAQEAEEVSTVPAFVRPAVVELLPGMIGATEVMRRLYRLTRLVAPANTTVLISGATGTGKELVARAIHALSPRAARPFVVVNCAAIPESLLESELFGHVRGAFTGAVQTNPGRICAAQGGTLFLDEVGELPLSLQAKLLRFLDQKEVQRLGSSEVMRADVRVVAATNADLARGVEEGKFRSDLYYRLSAFPLELPPLAERIPDLVPLAEHFLRELAAAVHGSAPKLSAETVRVLETHAWEGNVRELQQVMERAWILLEGGSVILPEHLYFSLRRRLGGTPTSKDFRGF